MVKQASVLHDILASAERFPGRIALEAGSDRLTYGELMQRANGVRVTLSKVELLPRLVAILAARSPAAYAGVLGVLFSGKGYMPLNTSFPVERCLTMLKLARTSTMIVGNECLDYLHLLLAETESSLDILVEDGERALQVKFPQHRFRRIDSSENYPPIPERHGHSDLAYVLFTSGSTGTPKGVQITHGNMKAYFDGLNKLYAPTEKDRFSQVHDLTFDPSAHDMFNAFGHGSALCVLQKSSVMSPASFIREKELSFWYSVPSVATFAQRLKTLSPGAFPSLRVSFFCGEPLPVATAMAWQKATPNGIVENLYGPTEATVSFTRYRITEQVAEHAHNGIVPLGKPLPGQQILIVDENLKRVAAGQSGELCLGGAQVSPGYWQDAEKNTKSFVHIAGGGPWYRTGDLVQDTPNGLIFLGRADFQVKVRGYRVELQEIEAVLSGVSGIEEAVVVPWPVVHGTAEGLVAFATSATLSEPELTQAAGGACKARLPEYMVPARTVKLAEIPRNNNGKVDREPLLKLLKEGK